MQRAWTSFSFVDFSWYTSGLKQPFAADGRYLTPDTVGKQPAVLPLKTTWCASMSPAADVDANNVN